MTTKTPVQVWYRHLPPITRDEPTADGERIVVVSPGATLVTDARALGFALSYCRTEDTWDPLEGLKRALRRWRRAVRLGRKKRRADSAFSIPNTPANRCRHARVTQAMEEARLWRASYRDPHMPGGWTSTPVVLPPPFDRAVQQANLRCTPPDLDVTAAVPVRGVKGVELPGRASADQARKVAEKLQQAGRPAKVIDEADKVCAEELWRLDKKSGHTPCRRLAARYRRERDTEKAARLAVEAKLAALRQSAGDAMRQWQEDTARLRASVATMDLQAAALGSQVSTSVKSAQAAEAKYRESMDARVAIMIRAKDAEAKLADVTKERDALANRIDSLNDSADATWRDRAVEAETKLASVHEECDSLRACWDAEIELRRAADAKLAAARVANPEHQRVDVHAEAVHVRVGTFEWEWSRENGCSVIKLDGKTQDNLFGVTLTVSADGPPPKIVLEVLP